jgi:hypothetical protein
MAQIMFLLTERSEDGQIDQPVFVTETHSGARKLAEDYVRDLARELIEDEGLDQSHAVVEARARLSHSKPTPMCHVEMQVADHQLVLQAVLVR